MSESLTRPTAHDVLPETQELPLAGTVEADVVDVRLSVASQWKLMWWRFRRHRLAVASVVVIGMFYVVALLCEFVAPHDPGAVNGSYKYVQPQGLSFYDAEGRFSLRPGTHGLTGSRDPVTLRLSYVPDHAVWYPLHFLVKGDEYKLWGVFPTDLHLFGLGTDVPPDTPFFLVGTDRLGRDMLSRIIYGARVSLSIGLVGVTASLLLGITLGGMSGYYGGWVDMLVQRLVEILRSIPNIPLLMAIGAAVPTKWSVEQTYFAITIVLGIVGWTGVARVVRGRFLSLREEDFVLAAKLAGSGERRIIFRHMLPSFVSHIIAVVTLAIPGMILNETVLSFLGLGLRDPAISWGVLLQDAQNVQTVSLSPWLLLPVAPVILIILCFNFFGDGLRDAADPYGR
jgi:peptide/nickel transport system permease protein